MSKILILKEWRKGVACLFTYRDYQQEGAERSWELVHPALQDTFSPLNMHS